MDPFFVSLVDPTNTGTESKNSGMWASRKPERTSLSSESILLKAFT